MRLRIPIAATLAAAFLWTAPPALAVGTSSVTSPADGASFDYRELAPATVTVTGTATGMAAVDLRCAHTFNGAWQFSPVLDNGSNIPLSGGAFSAPGVSMSTDDNPLCKLVAVPTGMLPSDLTGLGGPTLHLLIMHDSGLGNVDARGGANDGNEYDFYGTAGATSVDDGIESAGDFGLAYSELLNGDPGELGEVFSGGGYIPELDPTGPTPSSTAGEDGPLTGMLVDGVNSFNGYEWEVNAITSGLGGVLGNYTPYPFVSVTHSIAPDGSYVMSEHDTIVQCTTTDPMWYYPQGFTCQGLRASGVALDVTTTVSQAGNVVDRLWRLSSTDGRAHAVALWMANGASFNAGQREWNVPGAAGYATHRSDDVVTPPASGPWVAEFNTVGAADGDMSEGVGAVATDAVPSALRFDDAFTLDGRFDLAVPATGAAQIDTVYMSEARQAALDADVAAALARLSGQRSGGGGGGGSQPPPAARPSPPTLKRTGKTVLSTNGALALGYTLTCPTGVASACTATIALTQPVRRAARRRAHATKTRRARRAKPRTLGTLRVTVPSGSALVLTMRIARRSRAAFKAGHVTMTALLGRTGLATQTVVSPLPVKIAKPKPRRRAHRRR